jgi:hypothetical protein
MEPRTTDDADWPPTELAIERELATIRGAIEIVAGGFSPRVVLGGLRFAEEILPQAQAFAAGLGVRVVPLWMPDDAGTDLAIERIDG